MGYEAFLSSGIYKANDRFGRQPLNSYEYAALIEKAAYGESYDPKTQEARNALATARKVNGITFEYVSRDSREASLASLGRPNF